MVVDGSNLATEGRSVPSLAQLDEAVRAWLAENPDDEVIVVVDASFEYRIEEWERGVFEEAERAGEVLSPPAGAIGRGDGFLLRIAHRTDATVLSNDSFQEFHGQHDWLFEEGRLVGGKPVPGVGWIFTPRVPVRGPKSRVALRDAKRAAKQPSAKPARPRKLRIVQEPVAEAIAQATVEAMSPGPGPPPSGRRSGRGPGSRPPEAAPPPEAVNEPLPFITFIAEHRLGTEVDGVVESFASHGAFVRADGARCYVPVVGLGDPPPRSAKQVLKRGETRRFVVQALDAPRRGIELALPGLARLAGAPTAETLRAEMGVTDSAARAGAGAKGGAAESRAVPKKSAAAAPARKAPARKAPAAKTAAAKVAAPKKTAPKKTAAKKTAPKKTAAKKTAAKKTAAAASAKKAAAKKPAAASKTAAKARAAPATKTAAKAAPPTKTAAKANAAPAAKRAAQAAPARPASATKPVAANVRTVRR